jgi:putative lipoic acid-binding regulatory protein
MKCIQSLFTSLIWLIACIIPSAHCFTVISRGSRSHTRLSAEDDNNVHDNNDTTDDAAAAAAAETTISPASVTMDDGGSDLTDRFKYKVYALMGTFDPPEGKVDDENQMGNILGAMLTFPTDYTFSVVGRNAETENPSDNYATNVRAVMESVLGETTNMEMRVTPRGTKFTKVSVKVSVESASVIATIYEELGALESTVMKF